uniref:Uncharacterized protein n=1 Tax=Kuenenia stuttgartiensis TaxID=174633 RepID=Q1PXG8_KUEST|nr:unknown protein [Candidatus Kuenenia stuttgartiensis]
MLRPYTMRQTSLLLEFFKRLKCYKLTFNNFQYRVAPKLRRGRVCNLYGGTQRRTFDGNCPRDRHSLSTEMATSLE